jgi:predicted AlkP superfamily phosphohydrolase/phosphomutase
MSTRVLLIGIDSADGDLLRRWSGDGTLPTIGRLRQQGITLSLEALHGFGDDALWPSFSTGTSPARHGRYYFKQLQPGSYRSEYFGNELFRQLPFWIPLSHAGRRLAIIDVPKSPFVEGLNGVEIADWLVHGRDVPQARSWPSKFADEVVSRFGPPPPSVCGMLSAGLDRRGFHDLIGWLRKSVGQKNDLSESLLSRGSWDAFFTVFKESHCVSHMCWHLHDHCHPLYDQLDAESIGDPVQAIYRELDSAIGSLLRCCGPDTTVIVFSLIGMGANITGNPLLGEILRRLEPSHTGHTVNTFSALRSVWRFLPPRIRKSLHQPRKMALSHETAQAYRARKFLMLDHNEAAGAIRLNVAGREPNGRIAWGEEYDATCRALTQALMEIRDGNSGLPLVESVLPVRTIYPGELADRLPDLLVVWTRQRPIASAVSPRIGEVRLPYPKLRPGNHLPGGLLIARGPGIRPGAEHEAAAVTAIAPTIAALLGDRLPNCDGQPIEGLCAGVTERN